MNMAGSEPTRTLVPYEMIAMDDVVQLSSTSQPKWSSPWLRARVGETF